MENIVVLTTLPPSSADCLEILGASASWNPKGLPKTCNGIAFDGKYWSYLSKLTTVSIILSVVIDRGSSGYKQLF
jgi:hypothetical protein